MVQYIKNILNTGFNIERCGVFNQKFVKKIINHKTIYQNPINKLINQPTNLSTKQTTLKQLLTNMIVKGHHILILKPFPVKSLEISPMYFLFQLLNIINLLCIIN